MRTLSHAFSLMFLACILGFGASANEDWGNTGAMPMPVKDSERSNHWWWPKTPSPDASVNTIWGNAGLVYGEYTRPTPPPPPPPPPPVVAAAPTPPTVVKRNVPVLNNVLFGFDQFNLNDTGRAEIERVVNLLRENTDDTVVIEGHTDDINGSGNPEYNTLLGQRRADSVREVLLELDVAAKRVQAKSHGENNPAVPNTSDANRAKNRRVVFVYSIED